MDTQVIAVIAGGIVVLLLVIAWAFSRGENEREKNKAAEDIAEKTQQDQKFDTTFTPNSAANVTAPLVKGGKKDKQPFMPSQNVEQLSQAGKDETFLPQTATTAKDDDFDVDDDEALTEQQKK
ncbi:MAG: hypothetical protein HRU15_13810 [Planctomycetes bacterium]|nr:hypothetical protein [Planctomycetota bacterium]